MPMRLRENMPPLRENSAPSPLSSSTRPVPTEKYLLPIANFTAPADERVSRYARSRSKRLSDSTLEYASAALITPRKLFFTRT